MAIMESIESVYLESDNSTTVVTLDSIPTSYEHLWLTISAADDRGYYVDPIDIEFNNNASPTITNGFIQASGSSSSAYNSASAAYWSYVSGRGATGGTANSTMVYPRYGGMSIMFYDSANTSKNTTWICMATSCSDPNTTYFQNGLFDDTTAITQIEMTPRNGTNFMRGSCFSLYGIKSS